LRYRKDKRRLQISPRLQEILSRFKSIDDFRALKPKTSEEFPSLPNGGDAGSTCHSSSSAATTTTAGSVPGGNAWARPLISPRS